MGGVDSVGGRRRGRGGCSGGGQGWLWRQEKGTVGVGGGLFGGIEYDVKWKVLGRV